MVLATVALWAAALPGIGAADLDEAEERVETLEDELDATVEAYESAWAELEAVTAELDELERRARELEAEAEEVEGRLEERARRVFMQGAPMELRSVLAATGPAEAIQRAGLVSVLQRRQSASLEEAVAVRGSLDQVEQVLADRRERLEELREELAERSETMQEQLAEAQEVAERLRTREERRRQIERGAQQGTYACIFDPGAFRFRDTWGAPRSGGRSHEGTDIFAAMGAPVYAFTDGVISRHSNSGLGGIGLYLRGDDGNQYYYAHLQRIAEDASVGRRVEAGDHVAYNGASGNADASAPHVHFELHPGGGAPINPYPWLEAACY